MPVVSVECGCIENNIIQVWKETNLKLLWGGELRALYDKHIIHLGYSCPW